jgi:hypothetical protein
MSKKPFTDPAAPLDDQLDHFADEVAKAIQFLKAVASSIKQIDEVTRHDKWIVGLLASGCTNNSAEGPELSQFLNGLLLLARRQEALEKSVDDQNHIDFLNWQDSCARSDDESRMDTDVLTFFDSP